MKPLIESILNRRAQVDNTKQVANEDAIYTALCKELSKLDKYFIKDTRKEDLQPFVTGERVDKIELDLGVNPTDIKTVLDVCRRAVKVVEQELGFVFSVHKSIHRSIHGHHTRIYISSDGVHIKPGLVWSTDFYRNNIESNDILEFWFWNNEYSKPQFITRQEIMNKLL